MDRIELLLFELWEVERGEIDDRLKQNFILDN